MKSWYHSPVLPQWQKKQVAELKRGLPQPKDSLWMLSSGTQSVRSTKAINLSHDAIYASAASVNRHLRVTKKDRWAAAIPTHFIGGLSIYVRAELARNEVFTFKKKWEPRAFAEFCAENRVTLTSLVPTQVHDLARANLRAPEALRAAIIGGGALKAELYLAARALGWPVLPSYGLTETSSQVATASLESLRKKVYPRLKVLDHAEIDTRARVKIKARSLATYIATIDESGARTLALAAPGGWYQTADLAEKSAAGLKILGRADDIVKIKGSLVALPEVEAEIGRVAGQELCVLALEDPRDEHRLLLVVEDFRGLEAKLAEYNAGAPALRRLRGFVRVKKIPRGEMGKIKKAELRDFLFRPR